MLGRSQFAQRLPAEVKQRVRELEEIQDEVIQTEAAFYREVHHLEWKYAKKYDPLNRKRKAVVTGKSEGPASSKSKTEGNGKTDAASNGIPDFWLRIFTKTPMLTPLVKIHDEPVLKHLEDLKVRINKNNPMSFTLDFHFSPNDYFTNATLTKQYTLRCGPQDGRTCHYEGPEIVACKGCQIHWKKGRNVTVREIKQVQKHPTRGTKRLVTSTVQKLSFFNFFRPREIAPGDVPDEDTARQLTEDYGIGQYLRERVIPRAVSYYTGEMNDDSDDEDDEDDVEDNEDQWEDMSNSDDDSESSFHCDSPPEDNGHESSDFEGDRAEDEGLDSSTEELPQGYQSASETWREVGNKHYRSAWGTGISVCQREGHLRDAITGYSKALEKAGNEDDTAAAAKNYALATWKMACCLRKLHGMSVRVDYYFKESVSHFSKALITGEKVKNSIWRDGLAKSYNSCIQDYLKVIDGRTAMEKVIAIESIIHMMKEESHQADCYLQIANILFIHAIEAVQEGDFRAALSALSDCYRPVEEARRLARGREFILEEVTVMERDVMMQRCTAESLQARKTGDDLLEALLKNEEDLNMDGVYEVIDWYKKAVLLTRETEVEMEAIALSSLGKLYHTVLKQQQKAKENLMRAVQLAHSLHPRVFTSHEWFRFSTATLESYQKEAVKRTEEKENKERLKYHEEIKLSLEALEKASKGSNIDLLVFVYKTHPPKKSGQTLAPRADLEALGHMEVKKTLQKAILHYHPDKQDAEVHGKPWFYLCEEITKRLTAKYEVMKG